MLKEQDDVTKMMSRSLGSIVVGYCQNTNLISVTAKTNAVGEQSKTKDVTETKQERLIVTVGF